MMRGHHGVFAAAGDGGAPPAWTPASLSNRILHLDAGVGVTLSGSDLTAWADQSGAGRTITVAGAPQYSASDANLSSQPSITLGGSPALITADIADLTTVAFLAAAFYTDTSAAPRYPWDGTGRRVYVYADTGATAGVFATTATLATSIYGSAGIRRFLVPYDGATASILDGATRGVAPSSASATGANSLAIGSRATGAQGVSIGEIIACSTVPSAGDLVSLTAYFASKYP